MSSIHSAIHIRCLAVSPILFFPSTDNGHWGRSGRPPWVDEWHKIDWRCCSDPQFWWTYPTHFLYVTVHMWRRVAGPMTYSHLLICALPSSCTYIDLVYVIYLHLYTERRAARPMLSIANNGDHCCQQGYYLLISEMWKATSAPMYLSLSQYVY